MNDKLEKLIKTITIYNWHFYRNQGKIEADTVDSKISDVAVPTKQIHIFRRKNNGLQEFRRRY